MEAKAGKETSDNFLSPVFKAVVSSNETLIPANSVQITNSDAKGVED